jgi:hypothetical protein
MQNGSNWARNRVVTRPPYIILEANHASSR